jgi:uracil-DNA glycosylase family 4
MKLTKYLNLLIDVESCSICPSVDLSFHLISRLNGPLDADIMFIGAAPGKKTPGASLKPFSVGKSSDNFNYYLSEAGIDRESVHITNAVLHIPVTHNIARNPTNEEIINCNDFLKRQIKLVNPKIVVSLGSQALLALGLIQRHGLSVSRNAGSSYVWNDRFLFVMYHPSPLSRVSEEDQLLHYKILADFHKHLQETMHGDRN